MTRIIQRMKDDGLVKTSAPSDDGRVRKVAAADKGKSQSLTSSGRPKDYLRRVSRTEE
jgi:DNA-binding MarR family transcriptional regulator